MPRGEESITYANVRNVPVVKEMYGLVGGQFALQVGLCETNKETKTQPHWQICIRIVTSATEPRWVFRSGEP